MAKHHTYSSGGYAYELRGRLSSVRGNLSELHRLGWIDGRTRAVFIQFTIYNANVQLFTAGTLLAEILPTGGFETQSRFDPLPLQSQSRLPSPPALQQCCLI